MRSYIILACICLQSLAFAAPALDNTKSTVCAGKPADVIFVLDASSSIRPNEFRRQAQFVEDVVSGFDIGDSKTRVGLITFSEYAQDVFRLGSQHKDKMLMLASIANTYQLTGRTFTDRALLHAREMMRNEGRTDVLKIVILLTDGKSEFPQLTIDEAQQSRKNNIILFTIGIGNDIDKKELYSIASRKEFVFTVRNFAGLSNIRQRLTTKTCALQSDQADSPYGSYRYSRYNPYSQENEIIKESKTAKLEKACGGRPAEIVFCLDASGSIWGPDFKRQLDFVSDMTGVFQIAPNMTRIGVLTFGDHPREWFKLNTYQYEEEVRRNIQDIYQMRGGTNTGEALSTLRTNYFSDTVTREGVVKIAIVITDGKSSNRDETARQAALLREQGIYVFAIGVGSRLDEQELHLISSQPSKDYVFKVDNYKALDTIKTLLSMKTCLVTMPPTTTEPIYGCGDRRPADIVFAMPPDANAAQAAKVISMMGEAKDQLDMGDNAVRMGLVPKECVELPGLELTGDFDTDKLLREMENSFAAAHTPRILKYMRQKSFTEENGSRKHAQKMAIIILDKSSPNYKTSILEAAKAKKDGLEIFVIAIGDDITDKEVKHIASYPLKDHLIRVKSYSDLAGAVPDLVDMINKSCVEYIPQEEAEEMKNTIKVKRGPLNKMDLFSGFSRNS